MVSVFTVIEMEINKNRDRGKWNVIEHFFYRGSRAEEAERHYASVLYHIPEVEPADADILPDDAGNPDEKIRQKKCSLIGTVIGQSCKNQDRHKWGKQVEENKIFKNQGYPWSKGYGKNCAVGVDPACIIVKQDGLERQKK